MTLRDRVASWFGQRPTNLLAPIDPIDPMLDLPLRRDAVATRQTAESLTISPLAGMIDNDDYAFRRISTGNRFKQRDLAPMAQDRMLEIAWYIYETNPFGRRLINAMTDLVVGEGVGYEADDDKIRDAASKVWNHPINRLGERARELHNALALNGELCLPVMVNDVSGVPTIGFIDPYQIAAVETRVDNVLIPEFVRLKRNPGDTEDKRIRIVQQDPLTGKLDGECFYFAINKLPNSTRGRSDYLPLADWLDLFDQYMFANVERVRLLSAFVWNLEIKDADAARIQSRVAEIGTPQSGSVFAHNQHETMEAISPTLSASDHTETARLLTIHIAGSLGMPISWFGWQDANRATIEGQNDVAMKTPAARQKEFGHFLNQILRFGIERQRGANAILFKNIASDTFGVTMPEIAAKDISRVGAALGQIVSALDTAMNNRTMSRRVATIVQLALTKHLGSGFDFKADDVMAEADQDGEDAQARMDDTMAAAAALAAKGPSGRGNPPLAGAGAPGRKPFGQESAIADLPWLGPGAEQLDDRFEHLEDAIDEIRRQPAPAPAAPLAIHLDARSHVHPPAVHVHEGDVHATVNMPKAGAVRKTFELDKDPDSPTYGQLTGSLEEPIADDKDK